MVPTTINGGSRLPVLSRAAAICILGFHGKGHGSRLKGVILSLCFALLRPHLECRIQLWCFKHRRHGPVKVGPEEDCNVNSRLDHIFCEARLGELGFSLNKKASGRPYCGLSVFRRVFLKAGKRLFTKAFTEKSQQF